MLSSRESLEPKLCLPGMEQSFTEMTIESAEYSGCRLREGGGLLSSFYFQAFSTQLSISLTSGMEMTKSTPGVPCTLSSSVCFLKVELRCHKPCGIASKCHFPYHVNKLLEILIQL